MSVVLLSSTSATTITKSQSKKIPFLSPTTDSAKLSFKVSFSPSRSKLFNNPLRVAAPPSVPTSDPAEEQRVEEDFGGEKEEEGSEFKWRDHWYPVSLVEDLDPNVPTRFQLLGRDLVLWFDRNDQKWAAFDDLCPHRLAPLSEGRLDENGHLQCSYHGWSFSGCGSCTRIPQAATSGPEARAVKSPRACAIKFPAMVSQGLLFVWPDENGWERANSIEPPRLPDDFDKPEFSTVTIQRDLFYGYDTLMENVSDPSHIDFAHHKVTGRRDRAKPLPFKVESSGPWGFQGANDDNPRITAKFVAPCYSMNKIEIDAKLPIAGNQKWVIWICSFNIPMAPGKTRSIVCSARNFFQFSVPGPAWWQVVPRWYEHWTSNLVYDGDMIVLQGQEKVFLSKSMESSDYDVNKEYTKLTFTPTQADRFVLAFRNWLRRHGKSQPEWFGSTTANQPLPSTVLTKRQMLDRFDQHTQVCSSCKGAYNVFQTLKKFLVGATVFWAATAGVPSDVQIRLILAGLSLISAASAYALHEQEKNFVFRDYVHSEIE
ncbi:PREDICTED: pheophorbide a oxygenase, chloroplastic [Camelina sativa]|uniref:Pheophorbide a oxygenase, chloroplastic n=1 Tax=Camelina sativa TaxID=90675 RepID=A0ABM0ZEZ2_CAMSA|nr:PREDICTED: pheophorbide a oxygenase, chloroplastic [Camelina sativa]